MPLPLPSVPGAALPSAGGQAPTYASLKKKYSEFSMPQAKIFFGGAPFESGRGLVGDISIELTSGVEASFARFRIFGLYNSLTGKFEYDGIKKQVTLGNSLTIRLGYLGRMEPVFAGFVAGLNFGYEAGGAPYLEVTGMDIKGVMMSGACAAQLPASSYGEAVKKILEKTVYRALLNNQAVSSIKVSDTPDKPPPSAGGAGQRASAASIEMVSESDYEFVIKAAKRFNFEFFTDCGTVYFRPAKQNKAVQMELTVGAGLLEFDIGYSLTGLFGTVEARAADAGSGKLISSKLKWNNKISEDSKAKALVSGRQKVYIDSTIASKKDADARAASLSELMRYRFGSLECTCVGIPELRPGRFVAIMGLGAPAANQFYVTTVIHNFSDTTGYRTRLIGEAEKIPTLPPLL